MSGVLLQLLVDWTQLAVLSLSVAYLRFELGVVSAGQAAAAMLGAYALGLYWTGALNLWAALGAIILLALALASIAARVQNEVFTVVSLVLAEGLRFAAIAAKELTEGTAGLGPVPRPSFLSSDAGALAAGLLAILVILLGTWWASRRWMGLLLGTVRDNSLAASSVGIPVGLVRFLAVLASISAGASAGALQVMYFGFVTPQIGRVDVSLQALAAALLSAWAWKQGRPLRSAAAVLLAAFLLVAIPVLLRWTLPGQVDAAGARQAIFGLALFAMVHPRLRRPHRA